MTGTLFLCATPIGNRGDITARTVETLREADLIAAEDTRHSRGLMEYLGVETPLTSYHEHNKYEKGEELVSRLLAGENIALITDAGTPAISDPGEVLVNLCHQAGVPVTSLPGPCALITALTLSGMPARRFVFEGFLPMEGKERREVLESLKKEARTIILYEAPHRLKRTLAELKDALGEKRQLALCRELTKIHEEVLRMSLAEACEMAAASEPRGEYVLVVEGRPPAEAEAERAGRFAQLTPQEHLQHYLDQGLDKKAAMKQMAQDLGVPKREIYDSLLN
ncbi:MAG: 16S rRNA (cytidine(1402)-2'-O)-methyltransferase [Lachnospiraceae bacterium]|nr:16S rRNA (cytidine(1402)-2'-O)-methyltransferase [Lachnospiraceae bacterium]